MKTNDLITCFLDGLTSPEEEHQLRAMLEAKTTLTADEHAVLDLLCLPFPEEDTAALLAEDVSQSTNHHSQFFIRRLVVVSGIAAAVILTFLLWPEVNTPLPTSSQGEGSGHLQERAEAKTQPPTVEMTEGHAMMVVAEQQPTPASTPPTTVATRPPQAPKHVAKTVIPAELLPQEQAQVQCLSNEESMAADDAKAQLCSAEIELEQAVHQRQAAYEAEMMQRSLELLIYIMGQEDEEKPTGGVKTQKS